jgi:hypothetical protein
MSLYEHVFDSATGPGGKAVLQGNLRGGGGKGGVERRDARRIVGG